jgi:hypothetical protein
MSNTPITKTVTLDTPLKRGEQSITSVTLRKPNSGELRGLNLTDLLQMDVNSLKKVLPRITSPIITEQDVDSLDPADLVDLGSNVALFLVKKANQEQPSPTE